MRACGHKNVCLHIHVETWQYGKSGRVVKRRVSRQVADWAAWACKKLLSNVGRVMWAERIFVMPIP
eukprot:863965-Pleurochrysis_carterae.AAC.1